mmetsp:Transcript_19462/g.50624  ORF Transcript_19462/g.50624 Transcript_19462/m.50624 type:complete len:292 (-) Transcript_19462:904-1779(-)
MIRHRTALADWAFDGQLLCRTDLLLSFVAQSHHVSLQNLDLFSHLFGVAFGALFLGILPHLGLLGGGQVVLKTFGANHALVKLVLGGSSLILEGFFGSAQFDFIRQHSVQGGLSVFDLDDGLRHLLLKLRNFGADVILVVHVCGAKAMQLPFELFQLPFKGRLLLFVVLDVSLCRGCTLGDIAGLLALVASNFVEAFVLLLPVADKAGNILGNDRPVILLVDKPSRPRPRVKSGDGFPARRCQALVQVSWVCVCPLLALHVVRKEGRLVDSGGVNEVVVYLVIVDSDRIFA